MATRKSPLVATSGDLNLAIDTWGRLRPGLLDGACGGEVQRLLAAMRIKPRASSCNGWALYPVVRAADTCGRSGGLVR